MPIAAGRLRHRVRIEECVGVQNAQTLEITPTWQTVADQVPAAIEPLSVREFIAAQAMNAQLTARIVIRYRAGLNASMRIVGLCRCHQGRIFDPAGFFADADSGLEYLTAPVTEGVNAGR
jgi:SPP1 family predicted phage head-tail adaptor